MNLKALSALAAVAVCSFNPAPPAKAATSYCYETEYDDTICILSVRKIGANTKQVVSSINGGPRDITDVYCNPAYRYNYKVNMMGIACYQFN